jgi:hypothetical protein
VADLPPEILETALYTELLESCDWDEELAEATIHAALRGEIVDGRIQQIVDTLGKMIKVQRKPKLTPAES